MVRCAAKVEKALGQPVLEEDPTASDLGTPLGTLPWDPGVYRRNLFFWAEHMESRQGFHASCSMVLED